ncbi:zeta toxin family protein [Streptomyces sp. NPDC002889]|uniref:zeta toxin family protein n=1 Tax=Streptomyces sp. NPDC002889 TaxID=3364669 RepID=UPI00367364C0
MWWEQAQDHALSHGFNILRESAMVSPAEYEDICHRIRSAQLPEGDARYRIETAFVTVPGPVSRLGITTRYLEELQTHGHGRLVDPRYPRRRATRRAARGGHLRTRRAG